jgi:hypothetical protein
MACREPALGADDAHGSTGLMSSQGEIVLQAGQPGSFHPMPGQPILIVRDPTAADPELFNPGILAPLSLHEQ